MRYRNRELMDRLAGEYVLGSLTGGARRRFERLLRKDPSLEALVVQWQEELAPLADETAQVPPPPRVLENLKRRIAMREPQRPPWWDRLSLWRILAWANGALALLFAAYIGVRIILPPNAETGQLLYVGVLADRQQQPGVVVLAYNKPWRLEVESKAPLSVEATSELRIWIEDDRHDAPRYLATLAPGAREVRLAEPEWQRLSGAKTLLVSRESPASATDAPRGPILFRGVCVNLKQWSEPDLRP